MTHALTYFHLCSLFFLLQVIGRGGETIKAIQSATGARVQIDRAAGTVAITGSDQRAVDEAARMITELISSAAPSRGGPGGGMGGGGMGGERGDY